MTNWKNQRAEAEMRKHEAEMMKNLNQEKDKSITKEWKVTVTAKGKNAKELLDKFESEIIKFDSNANKVEGIDVTVFPENSDDEV